MSRDRRGQVLGREVKLPDHEADNTEGDGNPGLFIHEASRTHVGGGANTLSLKNALCQERPRQHSAMASGRRRPQRRDERRTSRRHPPVRVASAKGSLVYLTAVLDTFRLNHCLKIAVAAGPRQGRGTTGATSGTTLHQV